MLGWVSIFSLWDTYSRRPLVEKRGKKRPAARNVFNLEKAVKKNKEERLLREADAEHVSVSVGTARAWILGLGRN